MIQTMTDQTSRSCRSVRRALDLTRSDIQGPTVREGEVRSALPHGRALDLSTSHRSHPMRLAWLVLLLCPLAAIAQDTARYGISLDVKTYPQATAKEALASVLKAIDARKIDYLVAQLADPSFVDDRVKRVYAGKF